MGRVKLKIKRLESSSNRQVTYSKRRNGILKKAKELSILCDIDIILLMFSPTGRPTFFHGERSNLEEVIMKFSQLTPQERAKRKMESLEALKKTFKKLDHDVNIEDFLGASSQTVEELTDQVRLMQVHLSEAHKRLSCWSNPDKIDSMEHLRQMEDSLRESIARIRLHKETLVKQQLMPLECASNQFQSGMPLSLMMSDVQGAHSLSWLPNNCNQHQMLSNDPNFLSHRDVKCSTDASLPGYSGYFGTGKQREIENLGSVDNMGKDGALSDLTTSACLGFELGDQLSYRPYCASNLPNSKKLEPGMPSNTHGNHSIYQVNSNFELLRPISDNRHHTWVSASGPSNISMFDENSYHQQSN